ncbi:MAG: SUMF1/EgtB/PvdO family nonheme iron enzyme [Flavobacteriales bacterium]|nr:SUMF1/EgtB/PvdO family nonheme iron enzyme [Flavobacteriales bacterium]
MRKFLIISAATFVLVGCMSDGGGQLIGVQGRQVWYQPDPYGMLYIPPGSYNMGPSDQDAPYSYTSRSKTVSVSPFYMDETEITNNEYRQFVYWVRDSIAYKILGEMEEETYLITINEFEEDIDPPRINWDAEIIWNGPDEREALSVMFLPEYEQFYGRRNIDTRKLVYEYYWIDFRDAARKDPTINGDPLRERGMTDRSVFIKRDEINIYPDTLCWIHDFTYSFNEPLTQMYFWHPAYDDYPLVGVTWKQARAFSIWRTELHNKALLSEGSAFVQDYRLPSESEWEYAARGGLDLSPYPWGGPYTRNTRGCFLANFKPLRGNYYDDGGIHTVPVFSYEPNDFGLYCMAGNVAEWTANAFDESALDFAHDLNMDYRYEAKADDAPVLKRKAIRGGSWKDVGYYMQTSTRTYEYQDTAKSYIGFRNVMSYLGMGKSQI